MNFTDEAIQEFKTIIEEEFGKPCTIDQAREMAGRVMVVYEGLTRFLAEKESPATQQPGVVPSAQTAVPTL